MYYLIIFGFASLFLVGCESGVLVNESFDYPDGPLSAYFWSEGNIGVIHNHRLYINADTSGESASTVWLDRVLQGDMSIEFDVYLLSSEDDANNINVFFMCSDPSGKPLRATAAERENGLYKNYHKLNGFIITNVTNGNSTYIRYRFRRDPGFGLLGQYLLPRRKRRKGKIHIKLIKRGDYFEYRENNQKVFSMQNDNLTLWYNKGYFGFRTWHTSMEIDNLIIKKI
ncbi:MAG TPA: DUF6250 domain-containing protein [Hanamia sp.]|nr:DUF6250 domain-containing protein [Hanamia sp.]